MSAKEAKSRIKINKLLENSGWRFFDLQEGLANIALEPNVKLTQTQVDAWGNDFETSSSGFIDFLLLDGNGFPFLVLENYEPHIAVDPTWAIKTLGDACKAILTGRFGTALHESDYVADGIPVINPKNIVDGQILREGAKAVSLETRDRLQEFTVRQNDIVIGRRGEMGRCAVVTAEMNGWLCGTGCFAIRLNDECDTRFAHLQISSPAVKAYLEAQAVGVTMMNLNQSILSSLQFPLPDLETQRAIVAEIEAEQALVNANRELIRRMEAKVKAAIDRVWG